MTFLGKTAIVTGASSGIGRAVTEKLATGGARVFAVARRQERLEELAREFATIVPVVMDVCGPLDTLEKAIGSEKIDILVNNAGLAWGREPVHEIPRVKWETMIDTNVKALLAVTQLILPRMLAEGSGDVVNVGSVAGLEAYEGGAGYCASKFAVTAITDAMRHDLLGKGIRVVGIYPGMVETEFSVVRFDGDQAKADKVYEGLTPLTGGDVAEAIVWTLSLPRHVTVPSLTIFPTAQASATKVYRKP